MTGSQEFPSTVFRPEPPVGALPEFRIQSHPSRIPDGVLLRPTWHWNDVGVPKPGTAPFSPFRHMSVGKKILRRNSYSCFGLEWSFYILNLNRPIKVKKYF